MFVFALIYSWLALFSLPDTFKGRICPSRDLTIFLNGRDTIVGNANVINGSSQIWGSQSALIYTPRVSGYVDSISLHFASINNLNATLSRIYISTAQALSCNGPASDFGTSSYTIGKSAYIDPVSGVWNVYHFDRVYLHADSTYYIWPDLIPQISHRISWADASFGNLDMKATFPGLCTIVQGDYSALFHINQIECPVINQVTDSDCNIYIARDTLTSSQSISAGKMIRYSAAHAVILDTTFTVDQTAELTVDNIGCPR